MDAFGAHLRRWRHRRALSQLELATLAGTSTRHLSFLESGRSSPRREMVVRLAKALAVEEPERDRALEAAGLEPFHRRGVPDAGEVPLFARAIDALLEGHEPLPAFAIDADWRLLGTNGGGARLLGALGAGVVPGLDDPGVHDSDAGVAGTSLLDLLLALANDERIIDWPALADAALRRGRAELAHRRDDATDFAAALERLGARLERFAGPAATVVRVTAAACPPGVRGGTAGDPSRGANAALVPFRVRQADVTLSLVSMIAQFGGVDYVELDAPRVELMLPLDEPTRRWFDP